MNITNNPLFEEIDVKAGPADRACLGK